MAETARETGSIRQFDLHVGSFSSVLVNDEGLDRLARQLRTFDVFVLHRPFPLSLLDFHTQAPGCLAKSVALFHNLRSLYQGEQAGPPNCIGSRLTQYHTHRV